VKREKEVKDIIRFQISFEKSVKREKKMKNRINIKDERNIYYFIGLRKYYIYLINP
jgi:hypothetical protein